MFSNIFQKAALFGTSTVASVAFTGTMMANSAQAATMSYTSEFSITLNSLNAEVATGDLDFTKTELNSGLFSYKLTDFNASSSKFLENFGIKQSLSLSDITDNPTAFTQLNDEYVPNKYQSILPSILAGDDSNYVGDGDFPPENFTFGFNLGDDNSQTDNFDVVFSQENLDNVAELFSGLTGFDAQSVKGLLSQGGEVSFINTSTLVSESNAGLKSVPEPTTIFGLGIVGVGLTATRRKRAKKKIKQKTATSV